MNRSKAARERQETDEPFILANVELPPPPAHGDYWGRWRYDAENMVLEDTQGWGYWIPLQDIKDSASVLNWLAQLYEKNWTTDKDIGNLFDAFDDLFGGLQSKICGFGINQHFDLIDHLRKTNHEHS